MEIERFNDKYKEKGGILKLTDMMSSYTTHSDIGKYFGVSRGRAKEWIIMFFKKNYDPRKQRRERIIASMVDFAKDHTEDVFVSTYKGKTYLKEALEKCKELKIYQ